MTTKIERLIKLGLHDKHFATNAIDELEKYIKTVYNDCFKTVKKHYETIKKPKLLFFNTNRTIGYYYGSTNSIKITRLLYKHKEQLIDTLLHELAHAVTWQLYREVKHNKLFYDVCRVIGSTPERLWKNARFDERIKKVYAKRTKTMAVKKRRKSAPVPSKKPFHQFENDRYVWKCILIHEAYIHYRITKSTNFTIIIRQRSYWNRFFNSTDKYGIIVTR